MNALVEWASEKPEDAPVGVYAMHNACPYTIAVPAAGKTLAPKDLQDLSLVTHPNDASRRIFPEFCAACGIDPVRVKVEVAELAPRELVPLILQGRWDGLFGFVKSIRAQTIEGGLNPDTVLRGRRGGIFHRLDPEPKTATGAESYRFRGPRKSFLSLTEVPRVPRRFIRYVQGVIC